MKRNRRKTVKFLLAASLVLGAWAALLYAATDGSIPMSKQMEAAVRPITTEEEVAEAEEE